MLRLGFNRNLLLIGLLGMVVGLITPAHTARGASSSGMRITQVRIKERLDLEGNLWVTKEYKVHFSTPHHGIYKDIPKRFVDPVTKRHRKVEIDNIKVYNCLSQNNPHRYKVKNHRGYVFIKIGDPNRTITGDRCYGISYRVVGEVLRPSENRQALFWNLVGTGWNLSLHEVHAELTLPSQVKIAKVKCYRGAYRSRESCTSLSVRGNTVVMEEPVLLGHEALTLWVSWSPPLVKEKVIYDTTMEVKRKLFFLLSMAWVVVILLVLYLWYQGSTLSLKKSKMVLYHPPEEIGVLEAGVIIDNSLDGRDITAALISLAQKGYLKIDKIKDMSSLFSSHDYRLTLVKNPDANISPYEAIIISKIFGVHIGEEAEKAIEETSHKKLKRGLKSLLITLGLEKIDQPRTSVTLKEMTKEHVGTKLYSELSKVIYRNLQKKGYFAHTFKAARWVMGFLGFLIFMPINLGLMMTLQGTGILQRFGDLPIDMVIFMGNALLGMSIIKMSTKVGTKTKKGREITWRLMGLKEFISTAETDRLRRMYSEEELPDVFERFLPYAVIFGEEKRWGSAFDPIFQERGYSPSWYHGSDGFRASEFSHGISNSMSTATGGGGGAGGGGGGGGGGGW